MPLRGAGLHLVFCPFYPCKDGSTGEVKVKNEGSI